MLEAERLDLVSIVAPTSLGNPHLFDASGNPLGTDPNAVSTPEILVYAVWDSASGGQMAVVFYDNTNGTWLTGAPGPVLALSVGLSIFVIYAHRANMRRLLRGEEHRFRKGRHAPAPPTSEERTR